LNNVVISPLPQVAQLVRLRSLVRVQNGPFCIGIASKDVKNQVEDRIPRQNPQSYLDTLQSTLDCIIFSLAS